MIWSIRTISYDFIYIYIYRDGQCRCTSVPWEPLWSIFVAKGLHVPCYVSLHQDDVVEEENAEPAPPKMERRLNEETCPAYVPRLPWGASVPYSTCLWQNDKPFDRLTIRTISHECNPFNTSKWGWPTATGTVPTLTTKKWHGRKNMLKSVGVGVLATLSMLFADVNPLVSKVPSEWIIATPCPVKMQRETTRLMFGNHGTMGQAVDR